MTAQPVHPAPGPGAIPKTRRAIRAALPADQRAAFDEQWDNADLTDLSSVAALRDKWWARAVAAQDSSIAADRAAALAGELELAEPWDLGGRR